MEKEVLSVMEVQEEVLMLWHLAVIMGLQVVTEIVDLEDKMDLKVILVHLFRNHPTLTSRMNIKPTKNI